MPSLVKRSLAWLALQWTSGLDLKRSCIVAISAALGGVISMFIEFGARGQNESVMNKFRDFLGFIFDTTVSNPITVLFIILIGVALCFIFQMKTALAALYGGATVITILTTGLPQGQAATGGTSDASSQILQYAVVRDHEAFQGHSLLLTQIAEIDASMVLCPDDRKPYRGNVDVIWRVYHNTGTFKRHEMNIPVDPNGTKVPLPPLSGNATSYKYELTVRSPNMKTIYTNGSVSNKDKNFSVKVTTERGENNFFEWMFQPNVQSGKGENLSSCD